jgi:predicted adenine nucleotide alpha hydrolase (AANH) superfamily ATPase
MLLLNVCCAPCSLPIIESEKGLSLYFYSPNIYPREEYDRRLAATEQVAKIYDIELTVGDYDHEAWLNYVTAHIDKAPEEYPENSARCLACFAYRIDRTAEYSRQNKFKDFAMTLSVSRFKDVDFINSYGESAGVQKGVNYKPLSLDADLAHQVSQQLSKKHGIYRQKYCGCEFSQRKGS